MSERTQVTRPLSTTIMHNADGSLHVYQVQVNETIEDGVVLYSTTTSPVQIDGPMLDEVLAGIKTSPIESLATTESAEPVAEEKTGVLAGMAGFFGFGKK